MKDDKIYCRKEDGSFEPVGWNAEHLYDGIWVIDSQPGCRHITNYDYLCKAFHINPEEVSVDTVWTLTRMKHFVENSEEYRNILQEGSCTIEDLINVVLGCIQKYPKE